jgi:tRNA1(Val) A37 N6-methylase TrmN6
MKKNLDSYHSPDFYAFSEDSICLAKIASADIINTTKDIKVLDLGAGNGVVGIEFVKLGPVHCNRSLTCCEMQIEFKPYLLKNLNHFNIKANCYFEPFQSLELNELFDVILFNPPYFSQEAGRPAHNFNRQQCRFFNNLFFFDLEKFISRYLVKNGNFYLLYRTDQVQIDLFFPIEKYQTKLLWDDQEFLKLICVLKL